VRCRVVKVGEKGIVAHMLLMKRVGGTAGCSRHLLMIFQSLRNSSLENRRAERLVIDLLVEIFVAVLEAALVVVRLGVAVVASEGYCFVMLQIMVLRFAVSVVARR